MARQNADALATMSAGSQAAERLAASVRRNGKVILLGMGASHAVGRAVEPLYRDLGIEAIAIPLSEQLGQPLPLKGATVIVTSQSGESAEVLRWGQEHAPKQDVFGLTLEAGSQLAQMMPSLIGAGGREHAFAATRSLTITLAQHTSVLAQLGADIGPARAMLESPAQVGLKAALAAMEQVRTIVTSGRRLQGVAEAIALGLVELSRLPCFSLEGGQLRHGPMEMLGPDVGVAMFRGNDPTAELVGRLAAATAEAGSPTVVFDASGAAPVAGAVTVALPKASGLAALFAMLPVAQRFMVEFSATRVENVGTPVRSQKVTRIE
ncbi:aminotransferase [Actibacterium sp. MT2.3-13A]|uniref:SIS domain-containing protein n=1 Tax=Actibacterium sp. MT2.3-13A TaxID=2828332 RepID=UPI002013669D|nr:aminotransferase [Actibacterium sp. MT2.3-13A]